jgi:hypothetical protein
VWCFGLFAIGISAASSDLYDVVGVAAKFNESQQVLLMLITIAGTFFPAMFTISKLCEGQYPVRLAKPKLCPIGFDAATIMVGRPP